MGTQIVPPSLMQSEMPDPLTPDPATTPPETPQGNPAPAAPAANEPGDQPPATPAPGQPAAGDTPAPPVTPELVEMPDGRKLSAVEAVREMKENFLPEYTRATQELARLKENPLPTPGPTVPEPAKHPWDDPNWVPNSTAELLDAAVVRVEEKQQAKAAAETAAVANLRTEIESQLAEIKVKDPTLNEDELFKHANRFKFSYLRAAYDNMVEIRNQRKSAADEAVKNRIERAGEPVSGAPGAPGAAPGGLDWDKISNAGSTLDLVQEMLQPRK